MEPNNGYTDYEVALTEEVKARTEEIRMRCSMYAAGAKLLLSWAKIADDNAEVIQLLGKEALAASRK